MSFHGFLKKLPVINDNEFTKLIVVKLIKFDKNPTLNIKYDRKLTKIFK